MVFETIAYSVPPPRHAAGSYPAEAHRTCRPWLSFEGMAEQIMTVLGPIAPEDLGVTLAHEHLLFDLRCLWEVPPPARADLAEADLTGANREEVLRDAYHSRVNLHLDDPAIAVEEIGRFREAGGRSVLDLTTTGLAPQPEQLRQISLESGVQVIAGAGSYRRKCLDRAVDDLSIEAIADGLLEAVTQGFPATTVRAGILGELGTDSPIRPFEERQLRAAARVQRATGIAINVHPQIWSHEHLRILDILEEEGANLAHVALSHCDQLLEPEWHARIAERGVMLCFDTFGSEFAYESDGSREPTDAERIGCLRRLLDAGRAGQLLLSHDMCTRLQLHRWGGSGFDHLLVEIVPLLRNGGVPQSDLDLMLVANPARLLAMPADGA
jgi:phosphotriesterase-related protein